jgi:hypothetical protein
VFPPNEKRSTTLGEGEWPARRTVCAMKAIQLEKSIDLRRIEGSFANNEITDIFGIAASQISLSK